MCDLWLSVLKCGKIIFNSVKPSYIKDKLQLTGKKCQLYFRYMNAAKIGEDVLITAQVLKQGRTLAFASVDLTSKATGKLIAQGRHTKHLGSS